MPSTRSRAPLPKPRGALDREYAYRLGFVADEQVVSAAAVYAILRHIVHNGDLLDVPRATRPDGESKWLLVPVSTPLLDILSSFEGDDDEDDADQEDNGDDEPNGDQGQGPSCWAPNWRPDLFLPSESTRVVPLKDRRAIGAATGE